MKIFVRNSPAFDYDYPEEMTKIISYLEENGKLNVSGKRVEELYRQFSDECYAAGWISLEDEYDAIDRLEEFSRYLEDIDV